MKPEFVKFPRTHWLPAGEKPYKSERYLTRKELKELLGVKGVIKGSIKTNNQVNLIFS